MNKNISLLGFWSAIASTVTLSVFALLLLLSLIGFKTLYLSFVDVLLFGIAIVAMQAAIYSRTEVNKKVYALLALVFSVMFFTLISIAYYLQLAVVKNNSLNLSSDVLKLIAYTPGSLSFALDMLGFTFLCLSILILIPVFSGIKDRKLRFFLLVNGLLAVPTFYFPMLNVFKTSTLSDQAGSMILFAWCLIFLPIPILFAVRFKN